LICFAGVALGQRRNAPLPKGDALLQCHHDSAALAFRLCCLLLGFALGARLGLTLPAFSLLALGLCM